MEEAVEDVVDVDSTDNAAEFEGGEAKVFSTEFRGVGRNGKRGVEVVKASKDVGPMSLAGDRGDFVVVVGPDAGPDASFELGFKGLGIGLDGRRRDPRRPADSTTDSFGEGRRPSEERLQALSPLEDAATLIALVGHEDEILLLVVIRMIVVVKGVEEAIEDSGGVSTGIDDVADKVRALDEIGSPTNALGFNRIDTAASEAGGVEEADGNGSEVEIDVDDVPGSPSSLAHDGRGSLGKGVQQRRLSGVRRPREDDGDPVPDGFPPVRLVEDRLLDVLSKLSDVVEHGTKNVSRRDVAVDVVAKIDNGFRGRANRCEVRSPSGVPSFHITSHDAKGLLPLGPGLGNE